MRSVDVKHEHGVAAARRDPEALDILSELVRSAHVLQSSLAAAETESWRPIVQRARQWSERLENVRAREGGA